MATLHVPGTLSASESTQSLTEQHLGMDDKRTQGFLAPGLGCPSPTGSNFSTSVVTLADEKDARDDTFTVRDNQNTTPIQRLTEAGDMGRAGRPREPQELVRMAEVDGKCCVPLLFRSTC